MLLMRTTPPCSSFLRRAGDPKGKSCNRLRKRRVPLRSMKRRGTFLHLITLGGPRIQGAQNSGAATGRLSKSAYSTCPDFSATERLEHAYRNGRLYVARVPLLRLSSAGLTPAACVNARGVPPSGCEAGLRGCGGLKNVTPTASRGRQRRAQSVVRPAANRTP